MDLHHAINPLAIGGRATFGQGFAAQSGPDAGIPVGRHVLDDRLDLGQQRLFRQGRTASALGKRPAVRCASRAARCERATSSVAATAFMANRPWAAIVTAISVFLYLPPVRGRPSGFPPQGSSCPEALQFADLLLLRSEGRRRDPSSSAAVAVNAPCSASRRHVKSWFGDTPQRRATRLTVTPASCVCATISSFSATDHRRRARSRSGPQPSDKNQS
jgi:hypothetical protein